ncbi:hypothetical protein K466DRAFT_28465 [Polyporus arcularius HHB13444]|uniref:Uncharacterized protein n=1 Tax=Polyporus arcularius HHB13444 TaxID=1314778 RepID=A0A5C3NPP1_9APHY|nr:hypothetical protein K466DRAFT_28465 [Polyporus arcularius HHB13444]
MHTGTVCQYSSSPSLRPSAVQSCTLHTSRRPHSPPSNAPPSDDRDLSVWRMVLANMLRGMSPQRRERAPGSSSGPRLSAPPSPNLRRRVTRAAAVVRTYFGFLRSIARLHDLDVTGDMPGARPYCPSDVRGEQEFAIHRHVLRERRTCVGLWSFGRRTQYWDNGRG